MITTSCRSPSLSLVSTHSPCSNIFTISYSQTPRFLSPVFVKSPVFSISKTSSLILYGISSSHSYSYYITFILHTVLYRSPYISDTIYFSLSPLPLLPCLTGVARYFLYNKTTISAFLLYSNFSPCTQTLPSLS